MERIPIPVVIAILLNRRRVFLMKRARTKALAGQWEFPGGKVEVGEPPEAAIRRELFEELPLRVRALALFGAYSHVYDLSEGLTHYVLIAYRANVRDGPWSRAGRWMGARALATGDLVAGSRSIVQSLLEKKLVR